MSGGLLAARLPAPPVIEDQAEAATSLFAQTFQQINSTEYTKLDSF